MSAGWVAGTVRARAMARRRLGSGAARALAASPSLDDALAVLAATPYGHDVRTGQTLAEAQHAVAATLLWNLRVFAGWLPRDGGERLRVLAGWFELADVDELLRGLAGARPPRPLFRLGQPGDRRAPGLAAAGSPDRAAAGAGHLAVGRSRRRRPRAWSCRRCGWPGPNGSPPRCRPARPWALGGARAARGPRAVRRAAAGCPTPPRPRPAGCSGAAALDGRLARRPGRRPPRRRALGSGRASRSRRSCGGPRPAGGRGWTRDAAALLRRPRFGLEPAVGAVGAAAVDAWRVRAALECAARGGGALEVFDAVA